MNRKTSTVSFSVILPVLNEQTAIADQIRHIRDVAGFRDVQIIVADGDAHGSTLACVDDPDVVKVAAPVGRARQMNAGAAAANGEVLLFLHADTRLPEGAFAAMQGVLEQGAQAGAFDLAIESERASLAVVAFFARVRSRLERIPYGDQAHFIRAALFREIGGYPEMPLMEDVALFSRLKKNGIRVSVLKERVTTSARRWEKDGVLKRTLGNWMLRIRFALGADPQKLVRRYKPHSGDGV